MDKTSCLRVTFFLTWIASQGLVASADDAVGFHFFEPVDPPRAVQVMVHRGLMQSAPENTQPALEKCIQDHLEWAEVDVRLSKDGRHVLFHDSQLDSKTNGKGAVQDLDLAELLELDAGTWFAPRFAGVRLLSLTQCLAFAKGKLNLYLDCKQIDPAGLVREIAEAQMEPQVVVYADVATIGRIRELSGGKIATMTKWHPPFGFEEWLANVRPTAVEIDAPEITAEICKKFHRHGIKVQAKTLGDNWDRPEIWENVMSAGVDWIQTDLPVEVLTHALRMRVPQWPVKVSHHRGASRYAPENTSAAIEKSIRLKADYVELDIRTTQDGKFYLLHDGTLNRTTNGKGKISQITAEEIAKLDAGAWFGKPFAGAPVPTFDSGLALLRGNCQFYADAKDITPESLIAALEKYQLLEQTVVYQGQDYLRKLKQLNPALRLLPPLKDPSQLDALAANLKPYGVDAAWQILSKDLIERCHSHGILVFSDALGFHENVKDYLKAIESGIDVIQTDHPARVLRAIELWQPK